MTARKQKEWPTTLGMFPSNGITQRTKSRDRQTTISGMRRELLTKADLATHLGHYPGTTDNVTFSNITANGTLLASGNATLNGVKNSL